MTYIEAEKEAAGRSGVVWRNAENWNGLFCGDLVAAKWTGAVCGESVVEN